MEDVFHGSRLGPGGGEGEQGAELLRGVLAQHQPLPLLPPSFQHGQAAGEGHEFLEDEPLSGAGQPLEILGKVDIGQGKLLLTQAILPPHPGGEHLLHRGGHLVHRQLG